LSTENFSLQEKKKTIILTDTPVKAKLELQQKEKKHKKIII